MHFGVLSQTFEFNKVIGFNPNGSILLDWKDNLNIDAFIHETFKPCLQFITRSYDSHTSIEKNNLSRKVSICNLKNENAYSA